MPARVALSLTRAGPKVLVLDWASAWRVRNVQVTYDGERIGEIKDRKEAKAGKDFVLPNGSTLNLKLAKHGANTYWEPSIDGRLAYDTLVSQHRYIWISWLVAPLLLSISALIESIGYGEQAFFQVLSFSILIVLINWFLAFLVIKLWQPVAWIFATLVLIALVLSWLFAIAAEQFPPIIETIGVVIFRDFLVNARWISRILEQLRTYRLDQ